MSKYIVTVNSVQRWEYVMEVEAEDEESAKFLALDAYVAGEEGVDNWMNSDESSIGSVKEVNHE